MKFGENLYDLRKKQKISQEKLAEKIGVSGLILIYLLIYRYVNKNKS